MLRFLVCLLLAVGAVVAGCGRGPAPFDPDADPYLAEGPCGNLGYLPPDPSLSEAENRGRCNWYLYTAGGETMFRAFAIATLGKIDLIKILDSRNRGSRFEDFGLINDPGCVARTEPDEYGLWLDDCKDPKSAGTMGFRKLPNPHYKPALWSAEKYARNPLIEPPYRIGLTCTSCHMGFDPLNPPADPNAPAWENLHPLVGNQYLDETFFYAQAVTEEDTEWHVLKSQHRGTSDPTRLANDLVNNPNAIRPVLDMESRPLFREELNDGTMADTFHLFIDGSDFAVETAGMRVYLNVGMCFEYWATRHVPLLAVTPQKVFDMETAAKVCDDWNDAWSRMGDVVAFLKAKKSDFSLAKAPGGEAFLGADEATLATGKRLFADHCASCHSSKQPPPEVAASPADAIDWYRETVMRDDFLEGNILSTEARVSAVELGVNLARAMNNNSARGHIYEQWSSETYKTQPSGGATQLYNPFDPDSPIPFEFPPAQGYYKPFPLVGVWAFAPFLHNNALGEFTGDPSVEGRMKAFDDAVEKLMWPEKRRGKDGIRRTSVDSKPRLPGRGWLEVPAGTPTVLVANLDWNALIKEKLTGKFLGKSFEEMIPILLEHNLIPDFIEDRGHLYATGLPDADKQALIEYLKTL